jgi:hypothetical protein
VTLTPKPTLTSTPSITPTAVPPQITGVSVSSITRSGATISWTTNVPATSQVEYGFGGTMSRRSSVDASLLTSHRQILTGLIPGLAYSYRVRSVSAAAGIGVSTEASFTTGAADSGPEIGSITARRVTSTTATLAWLTGTGGVAQVEYGTTSNYGAFTLLKVFAFPAQEMVLTGLRPLTDYHFRVKAWDGGGALGASGDFTFTTAPAGPTTLLGDQTVQPQQVRVAGGQAAAYQYVAAFSGQASVIRLFVDSGTTAPVIRVGLYTDHDGSPGAILTQGSVPGLTVGWASIAVPPVSLVQSQLYWIVVLSPLGNVNLRDSAVGGSSLLSSQTTLAAFPAAWVGGALAARAPMSAYVQQLPPAITLLEPTDGSTVGGNVPLSAVVDDDAPIARLQFFVDGLPVGLPITAPPFATAWDTAGGNPNMPHLITARATDMLGRSGAAGMVWVQVDNGPAITNVQISRGLTASSLRITWSTDVLADGQVEFGPTTAYGSTTPTNSRLDWSHETQLTGLAPGMTYHYRVRSRDANGAAAVSADGTFFTPEP